MITFGQIETISSASQRRDAGGDSGLVGLRSQRAVQALAQFPCRLRAQRLSGDQGATDREDVVAALVDVLHPLGQFRPVDVAGEARVEAVYEGAPPLFWGLDGLVESGTAQIVRGDLGLGRRPGWSVPARATGPPVAPPLAPPDPLGVRYLESSTTDGARCVGDQWEHGRGRGALVGQVTGRTRGSGVVGSPLRWAV